MQDMGQKHATSPQASSEEASVSPTHSPLGRVGHVAKVKVSGLGKSILPQEGEA